MVAGRPPPTGAYGNTYAWLMTLGGDDVVDGAAFYDGISFNERRTRVRPRR